MTFGMMTLPIGRFIRCYARWSATEKYSNNGKWAHLKTNRFGFCLVREGEHDAYSLFFKTSHFKAI